MYLSKLYVKDFRNISEVELNLSPYLNIVLGKNGQGKTNLLEGISLLSTTKSFRAKKPKELIRWGAESASVFATLHREESSINLAVQISSDKRTFYKNDEEVTKINNFLGTLLTVTFIPQDLELIKGSPAGRRVFLDKCVVDISPEMFASYSHYRKALEHKNALLRNSEISYKEISPWNEILAKHGAKIFQARFETLKALERETNEELEILKSPEKQCSLELETKSSSIESEFYHKLEQSFQRERERRGSVFGVHRDDVAIRIDEIDARSYASQGQTRSLVIALKLGSLRLIESRRHEAPVVLLDDVDSELDSTRRENLLTRVQGGDRQVIITGTGGEHFDVLENAKRFLVSQGQVI